MGLDHRINEGQVGGEKYFSANPSIWTSLHEEWRPKDILVLLNLQGRM